MLITFKSEAYANITMFGDVGLELLKMMQFGTAVPGAIEAANVPAALDNLKQALAALPEQAEPAGEAGEDQPAVSLHARAFPLLEMLQAAIDEETYVRWE